MRTVSVSLESSNDASVKGETRRLNPVESESPLPSSATYVRRSPRAPGVGIYSYVHSKTTEFLYLRYLRYSILVARAAPPTNGSAALAGARCCDRERASAQRAAAGSLSAPVCQEGFALY